MPGDSISVRGNLLSSQKGMIPFSKYVVVELANEKDSVLIRKKIRCGETGKFAVKMETYNIWPRQIYYLRAYTRFMQNFNPHSFPVLEFPLGVSRTVAKKEDKGVNCLFFPEGNAWINGSMQRMTVFITNDGGDALEVPFCIKKNNKRILDGKTTKDGLATFTLHPEEQDHLFLEIAQDDKKSSIPFPERSETVTLQSNLTRNKIVYKILTPDNVQNEFSLFLFSPSQTMQKIDLRQSMNSGIITIPEKEQGLYLLILADNEHRILSTRSMWQHEETPDLKLQKTTYRCGEKLELPATFKSTNSHIRIVPKGDNIKTGASIAEIESRLLSKVPFREEYIKDEAALDLWLHTATPITFNLNKLIRQEFQYSYLPEKILSFSGTVLQKNKKALRNGTMVVYNTENNNVFTGDLDESGNYILGVEDFKEGDRFFLQAHPLKGKDEIYNYIPANDTFPEFMNSCKLRFPDQTDLNDSFHLQMNEKMKTKEGEEWNITLSEIVIKAKIKNEEPISTNKFYKMNYLGPEELSKRNYNSIEQMIRALPGVRIFWEDDEGKTAPVLHITSSRGSSLLGTSEMVILVDGIPMTSNDLVTMVNPQNVSSVEVLKPWQAIQYVHGAIDGALSFTTFQSNKSNVKPITKGIYYFPLGLSGAIPEDNQDITIPSEPGDYELLVDRIEDHARVVSYRIPIRVL